MSHQNGYSFGHSMDVDERVALANGRLRSAKVGVSIERRGGMLWLRGTFPPKPGTNHVKPYRQKFALGVKANPAGVQHAEKQARLMGAQLNLKQFDWVEWLGDSVPNLATVADWIERYAREFQPTVEAETWRSDYQNVFAKLPSDVLLTADLLRETVLKVATDNPNSRNQRRYALTLERLGKFAGLEVDFSHLRGNYSASEVEPRDIPSDKLIAECFAAVPDLGWRWVFGMVATFGLRSHEVFYLDTEELQQGGYMVVVKEGKTGRRLVWACYPEWVEAFGLRSPQFPPVSANHHSGYTPFLASALA